MVQFIRKHAKLIFICGIILLLAIGYLNYFLHKSFGIGCQPDPFPAEPVVVVDDWTKPLIDSGYKPATVEKPDHIAGDKIPDSVDTFIYASGVASDSIEVEVSVVIDPEGVVWLKGTYNGEDIKFHKIQVWNEPKPVHGNRWSLLATGSMLNGIDFGVGASYRLWEFWNTGIGVSATVDINETINTAPDWIAVNARLSRRYGAFSIGADIGYRLGQEQGLNVGISVGVAIGI